MVSMVLIRGKTHLKMRVVCISRAHPEVGPNQDACSGDRTLDVRLIYQHQLIKPSTHFRVSQRDESAANSDAPPQIEVDPSQANMPGTWASFNEGGQDGMIGPGKGDTKGGPTSRRKGNSGAKMAPFGLLACLQMGCEKDLPLGGGVFKLVYLGSEGKGQFSPIFENTFVVNMKH